MASSRSSAATAFMWGRSRFSAATALMGSFHATTYIRTRYRTDQQQRVISHLSFSYCEGAFLLSYRGKRPDQLITQSRVILITLSPPLNGGIYGASEPYTCVCTLAYPLRLIPWGTRESCFSGCTRKSFYKRNVRREVRTRDPDDVKREGVT